MADQDQYLSTDPAAGLPGGYLSMDPAAGTPAAKPRKYAPLQPGESKEAYIDRAINEFGGMSLPGPAVVGQVNPVAQALSAAAQKGAKATKDFGAKLVLSFVKPRFSELQRRAAIEGVRPTTSAKNIANFMVENRLTNAGKAEALGKAAGRQVEEAVAAVPAGTTLDTAERIPRYLNTLLRRVERQILPRADRTAIQNTAKELVDDSPLSRSTYQPLPAETLEAGLARGARSAITEASNVGKPPLASGTTGSQFSDAGGAFPRSIRPRELRSDVTPAEALTTIRTKSFFNKDATGGQVAAGRTIERALRDSLKQAVPATRAPLMTQGRAKDAFNLLERGEHLAQNRDTLGGFAQTMALSGNLRGLLAQLLKESQLRLGAGAAPRVAARLEQLGQSDPAALQAALASLMASHGQE